MKLDKAVEIAREHLRMFGVGQTEFSMALDLLATYAEDGETEEAMKGLVFVRHISRHLNETQDVICKICGRSVDFIYEDEKGY